MDGLLGRFILVSTLFTMLRIAAYFVIALIVYRLAWRVAGLILRVHELTTPSNISSQLDRFAHNAAMMRKWAEVHEWLPTELKTASQLREQRHKTLRGMVASAVGLAAFIGAILASLSEFADPDTIVWMVGLVGSALAFAGRTQVGDLLAGIGFIFQDPFDVGEKVLVKAQLEKFEGIIEQVTLSATWLRAPTGELFILPNGEMRFICNYSRGSHSSTNVTIKIAAADLERALPLLKKLGEEAVDLLPGLKEPWRVVSETGVMGQNTELTLSARADFGYGADLRPQMLRLIQKRLAMADIPLAA